MIVIWQASLWIPHQEIRPRENLFVALVLGRPLMGEVTNVLVLEDLFLLSLGYLKEKVEAVFLDRTRFLYYKH